MRKIALQFLLCVFIFTFLLYAFQGPKHDFDVGAGIFGSSFLAAVLFFFYGLVRPKYFAKFIGDKANRKSLSKMFGSWILITMILTTFYVNVVMRALEKHTKTAAPEKGSQQPPSPKAQGTPAQKPPAPAPTQQPASETTQPAPLPAPQASAPSTWQIDLTTSRGGSCGNGDMWSDTFRATVDFPSDIVLPTSQRLETYVTGKGVMGGNEAVAQQSSEGQCQIQNSVFSDSAIYAETKDIATANYYDIEVYSAGTNTSFFYCHYIDWDGQPKQCQGSWFRSMYLKSSSITRDKITGTFTGGNITGGQFIMTRIH